MTWPCKVSRRKPSDHLANASPGGGPRSGEGGGLERNRHIHMERIPLMWQGERGGGEGWGGMVGWFRGEAEV